MTREAMKQALEALEDARLYNYALKHKETDALVSVLRAALDAPEWVGLTDEDAEDCAERVEATDPTDSFWKDFARAIEAKLKEKNT
jgi:hypothetical protein